MSSNARVSRVHLPLHDVEYPPLASGQGKGESVVDMAELVGNTEGFADSG